MFLSLEEFEEMGGVLVDETPYERWEFMARHLINHATHGRIANEDPVRDAVKYCMFALISAIQSDELETGVGGRGISSMSNDSVSVTYGGSSSGMSTDTRSRRMAIIREYLLGEVDAKGTPLLCAGVPG